jgi:hypothetical protein
MKKKHGENTPWIAMDPQMAGRFWVFIQLVQLGEPIITSQYDMGQKPTSKIGMQHDASLKQGCMI